MKHLLIILSIIFSTLTYGKQLPFKQVYEQFPHLPKGVLEAVAWSNTRMHNIQNQQSGCTGMPKPYGVMGLFSNGKGYFIENGRKVAVLSHISIENQKSDVLLQLKAYAYAFQKLYNQQKVAEVGKKIYQTFLLLSEIPMDGIVNLFARDAQVYQYLWFMQQEKWAKKYHFPAYNFDLENIVGTENYAVLSAPKVIISAEGIHNEFGDTYTGPTNNPLTIDYSGAIWNPTPCNYNSRPNGANSISAITIHDTEGSYAGAISWFHNCNANVSAHYVLRSSDGQITQVVDEKDRAWHVGSENDYTIGLEHEGYVAQTGWYTTAMYNASATLVRDICNRRGINKKRVGFFPWMPTTYYNQSTIPGNCVRIKGHQHYPNQTHNDPGPNWDWERYDNLINNSITPTVITSINGSVFDTGGSSGNYSSDERTQWLIAPSNVTNLTLNFTSFSLENTWDYLYIYDGNTVSDPLIGKYTGSNSPGVVTSNSGQLLLYFKSDCANVKSGWKAIISTTPVDDVAPTTQIDPITQWKTTDFTAGFVDADNNGGSGIHKSFYQVIDYNGFHWGANYLNGFFSDNFDSTVIYPHWSEVSGTWQISSATLQQTDEGNSNTNIYAPLTQNLSNEYLFIWRGKIAGSGTNRRAGLHLFCDNPTQSNRGNSYFVYYRVDNQKVQIYKVVNNTFTLVKNRSYPLNANQWYEFAVRYNRILGKLSAYVNGVMVTEWVDSSPIVSGDYISLRSGNCTYQVDNFKVYRSRYPNESISVGPANTNDIRYQNQNPATPSGKIKSIVVDNMGNLSAIDYQFVNVDWSPPINLIIDDGYSSDIDTVFQPIIKANWSATDQQSGIANYSLAIGTASITDDVLSWSNIGTASQFAHSLVNPVYGQVYYYSFVAQNNAGLLDTLSSDGQLLLAMDSVSSVAKQYLSQIKLYPNPTASLLYLSSVQKPLHVQLYNQLGKVVLSTVVTQDNSVISVRNLAAGTYNVVLFTKENLIVRKIVIDE